MSPLARTARLTGLAYLGLAISGMLGFLLIRQRLYVPGDALATAANLVDHEALARIGTTVDLTVVLTQALAALLFFRLFRSVDSFAAGAIAAFGMVNAVVILIAAAFSATALRLALDPVGPAGDPGTAQVLLHLTDASWSLAGLFFGLWLIPMGWLARRSGFMPRALGWLLMAGGVGYLVSTYVAAVAPGLTAASSALTLPATAGELWMVGYLLLRGVGTAGLAEARRSPLAARDALGHGGIPASASR